MAEKYNYRVLTYDCVICEKENPDEFSDAFATLDNQKLFMSTECSRGHTYSVFLHTMRYGHLFETALYAYLNENYQESFIQLYSSLEVFWKEFVIAYQVEYLHLDLGYVLKSMEQSSNLKYSERRYGAFQALFGSYFREIYGYGEIISKEMRGNIDDIRNFRNSFVHNGELITKENLSKYIWQIYQYINSIEQHLKPDLKPFNMTLFTSYLFTLKRYASNLENVVFQQSVSVKHTLVGSFKDYKFERPDTFEKLITIVTNKANNTLHSCY